MVHFDQQPMRPPRRAALRRLCPCGRRARYRSRAPHSDGRVRADRTHTLCFACFDRQRDSLRGRRLWRRPVPLPACVRVALGEGAAA